ncbi:hypothetical protein DM02DRAFT_621665 [Periconia macrospinosa]|uniref:Tat pathway signal sequence n=1 Tax=Periconia macrospinosa TaxID=97972 RepID=A0A2V1EC71_9PLEO|nr:hypothetical protein DM02DRAFT_621665 [Periconia macrospinosa]
MSENFEVSEKEPFLEANTSGPRRSKIKRHWVFPTIVNIVVCLAYTVAYHSLYQRHQQVTTSLHGKTQLHFPSYHRQVTDLLEINDLKILSIPKAYDDFEKSPFAGPPSQSLDAAWHDLLKHTTIRVTKEELQTSNQTSIELPEGGGYMAWLGVFHELHCIWIYRDHYHPNLNADDVEEWSIHADHCMDILRSAAICHADTTLTTFGWANKTKPMLNTRPIDHKCIDWEALMDSVESRIVPPDEMTALRNPLLE